MSEFCVPNFHLILWNWHIIVSPQSPIGQCIMIPSLETQSPNVAREERQTALKFYRFFLVYGKSINETLFKFHMASLLQLVIVYFHCSFKTTSLTFHHDNFSRWGCLVGQLAVVLGGQKFSRKEVSGSPCLQHGHFTRKWPLFPSNIVKVIWVRWPAAHYCKLPWTKRSIK